MTTERRLVSLRVSPWSERAKWALDHHRLEYRVVEHQPFLGERRLRRIVGAGKQLATVPVLIAGGETITESWDIVRYTDREGAGAKLIPAERETEIRRWNDLADATMSAGRVLVVASLLASPAALLEELPPEVPRWLRPALRPVVRYGTQWFARKHGLRLSEADAEASRAKLRSTFEVLRAQLASGSDYLLGSFCYADMVMAICLQGVQPVSDEHWRLPQATRRAWTIDALAGEFSDLIAWRDRLYDRHRDERSAPHLASAAPMGATS